MTDVPKGDTPRPDDLVQVTFSGQVAQLDDHGNVMAMRVEGTQGVVYVPAGAVVEVLERADKPLVGEVRREEHPGGYSIWQAEQGAEGPVYWRCVYSTAGGNRDVKVSLAAMLGQPVIGAVPGTPADVPMTCPRCGSADTAHRRIVARVVPGDKVAVPCDDSWHEVSS